MKNISLYAIIVLLLVIIFGWLYLDHQINDYKKLYNECIEGRSIDTIYIDTTTHTVDIIDPIPVKEKKKKLPVFIDTLDGDVDQFLLEQYSNIVDEYYVDREYLESFGDSLVSITLRTNVTGKLISLSPSWKLTIPPVINRIDTVKVEHEKKNQYFIGLGAGTDTTLNVSLLFVNKKRAAFSYSVNTLDLIDKQFPKMKVDFYYRFR